MFSPIVLKVTERGSNTPGGEQLFQKYLIPESLRLNLWYTDVDIPAVIFTLGIIKSKRYCHYVCHDVHPSVQPERYHSNCLRIPTISLKFDGMVPSTTKQIAN